MIEFACPGCTKTYEANRAFVGFETRCLRCGTAVQIPEKSGTAAAALSGVGLPANPKSNPNRPAPATRPAPRVARMESEVDFGPPLVSEAASEPAPPKRRAVRAVAAESVVSEPSVPSPAVTTDESKLKKRKKQKVIGGSVGGGIAVVALLAFALSGSGKPKSTPAPEPSAPTKQETPPPPPPPPKPRPVYEAAPMPRAVRPAVEYELTAAALLLEYGEGPAACDQKYAGRDLLVRGVFHQYRLGRVALVPSDEKGTPISFALLQPLELRPGELLTDPGLTPGQAVVLRGTYTVGCRFIEATVEASESVADRTFVGKAVCLEGAVIRGVNRPSGSVPFPSLVLEPPATDSKISVTCLFKLSELVEVMKLKTGMRIDISGRCSGRTYTAVRFDNCAILAPDGETSDQPLRTSAESFFHEFETDLLASPRVNLSNPATEILPVTAEGLGHSYQVDPRPANIAFRNKAVQVSGIVKERHANTRMLVLQCGTDTSFSVAAFFSPAAFATLPEDRSIVVRGICSGLAGGYIRIESAEYAETKSGAEAARTHIEFLPYRLGKEHIIDQIAPGRTKDSPIKRSAIRFAGDDLIQVVALKVGMFPGTSLFKDPLPESKWYSSSGAKPAPQLRRYRVRDGVVEIGQPHFANGKDVQEFWEPVIKAGLKKGQSWSIRFPDSKIATYSVMDFTKDASGAEQLEIKRTLRDPLDPTRWEENGVTYLRGVGEVRRIVSYRTERGEALVVSESRLVTDGSPPLTAPELKAKP